MQDKTNSESHTHRSTQSATSTTPRLKLLLLPPPPGGPGVAGGDGEDCWEAD